MNYWLSQEGLSLASLAEAFAQASEFIEKNQTRSTAEIVNQFYIDLFGRESESEGRDFWVQQIEAALVSIQQVGLAISDAALNSNSSDAQIVEAKIQAAESFTQILTENPALAAAYSGSNGIEIGLRFLAEILTPQALPPRPQDFLTVITNLAEQVSAGRRNAGAELPAAATSSAGSSAARGNSLPGSDSGGGSSQGGGGAPQDEGDVGGEDENPPLQAELVLGWSSPITQTAFELQPLGLNGLISLANPLELVPIEFSLFIEGQRFVREPADLYVFQVPQDPGFENLSAVPLQIVSDGIGASSVFGYLYTGEIQSSNAITVDSTLDAPSVVYAFDGDNFDKQITTGGLGGYVHLGNGRYVVNLSGDRNSVIGLGAGDGLDSVNISGSGFSVLSVVGANPVSVSLNDSEAEAQIFATGIFPLPDPGGFWRGMNIDLSNSVEGSAFVFGSQAGDFIRSGASSVVNGGMYYDVFFASNQPDVFSFGMGYEIQSIEKALAITTDGAISANRIDLITGFQVGVDFLDFAYQGAGFDFNTGQAGIQRSAALGLSGQGVKYGVSVFDSDAPEVAQLGNGPGSVILLIDTNGAGEGTVIGSEGAIEIEGVSAADLLAASSNIII